MNKEPRPTVTGSMLIVSGPPGAGKSTVARALTETAERPTVHLAIDQFYMAIRKGFVLPFLPAAAQQNETVNGVVVAAAAGYAGGGYDVVVDGIVGPWSLPVFVAGAQQAGIALSLVVLRPSKSARLRVRACGWVTPSRRHYVRVPVQLSLGEGLTRTDKPYIRSQ